MRESGQPHDGAAPSAGLTPGSAAGSRAVPGIFISVLLKGVSAVHHHLSAFQQHTPGRCSELGTKQGGLAMGWGAAGGGAGHGAELWFVCLGWWHCRVLLGSLRFLVAPILCGGILPSVLAAFNRDRGARAGQ